jgi:hypothetical protein
MGVVRNLGDHTIELGDRLLKGDGRRLSRILDRVGDTIRISNKTERTQPLGQRTSHVDE